MRKVLLLPAQAISEPIFEWDIINGWDVTLQPKHLSGDALARKAIGASATEDGQVLKHLELKVLSNSEAIVNEVFNVHSLASTGVWFERLFKLSGSLSDWNFALIRKRGI